MVAFGMNNDIRNLQNRFRNHSTFNNEVNGWMGASSKQGMLSQVSPNTSKTVTTTTQGPAPQPQQQNQASSNSKNPYDAILNHAQAYNTALHGQKRGWDAVQAPQAPRPQAQYADRERDFDSSRYAAENAARLQAMQYNTNLPSWPSSPPPSTGTFGGTSIGPDGIVRAFGGGATSVEYGGTADNRDAETAGSDPRPPGNTGELYPDDGIVTPNIPAGGSGPSKSYEVPIERDPVDEIALDPPTSNPRQRTATAPTPKPGETNAVPDTPPPAPPPPATETPIGRLSPEELARIKPRGAGPAQSYYGEDGLRANAPIQGATGPAALGPDGQLLNAPQQTAPVETATTPGITTGTTTGTATGTTTTAPAGDQPTPPGPASQAALEALKRAMRAQGMMEMAEGERALRARAALNGAQRGGGFGQALGDFYSDSYTNMNENLSGLEYGAFESEQERNLKEYLGQLDASTARRGQDRSYDASIYGADSELAGRKYGADRGYQGTVYSSDSSKAASMYGSDRGKEGQLGAASMNAGASRYGDDTRLSIAKGGWDVDREENFLNYDIQNNSNFLRYLEWAGKQGPSNNLPPWPGGNIVKVR